ncbi:MAG TPA: DUF1345 domain-containing protein [Xanthobacteraceae bacterium]|jgi:uncharacterized membrane protein
MSADGALAMANRSTRPARRLPYVLRLIHARPRLAISVAFGILVAVLSPSNWGPTARSLVGWDAGVTLYLILVYSLMACSGTTHIRAHAAREDEGRLGVLMLTVLASVASLGAIVAELGVTHGTARSAPQLALATATIVLSWGLIQTIFALHYAHDYYGEHGAKSGGLKFPGEQEPDYWDFVYFALVIGMTAQVSDVAVEAKRIRRAVSAHGVVSFFFNAALLALMVNIAASAI